MQIEDAMQIEGECDPDGDVRSRRIGVIQMEEGVIQVERL